MSEAKELVLGEKYTDRYSGATGAAMEIIASQGGCFQVAIQQPLKEDGEVPKFHWTFDSQLDDADGTPMAVSAATRQRAEALMGKRYTDPASALTGVGNAVRFMVNGTEMLSVQPKGNGAEMPKSFWIDSHLLEEIPNTQPVRPVGAKIGAPSSEVRRI